MGQIYLIGAGPGDPGLLTVRGASLLQQADVVLYDRLVSEEVLALAGADAERIYVGKHEGQQEKIQARIYELFVRYAGAETTIVRLKGGDPMVFGRGVEEWLFLKELGYSVEIVPGVSSSVAAPALAGIPVTARGVSQGFAVITGQCCGESGVDWSQYLGVDTLVILMAARKRARIAAALIAAGRAASEPVAFVERGSFSDQRVVRANLGDVARGAVSVRSPAVFVVGSVTKFAEQLNEAVEFAAADQSADAFAEPYGD